MAAPLAGMALAERGGQAAAKALTADIIVINGKYYREIRTREPTGKLTKAGRPQMRTVRRLEPVDIGIHVNPVSIAVGAGVALVGAAIGTWLLGLGLDVLTPDKKADLETAIAVITDESLPGAEAIKKDMLAYIAETNADYNACIRLSHNRDLGGDPAYCEDQRKIALARTFEFGVPYISGSIWKFKGTAPDILRQIPQAEKEWNAALARMNRKLKVPVSLTARERWPALVQVKGP